jgi:hypothetical protein
VRDRRLKIVVAGDRDTADEKFIELLDLDTSLPLHELGARFHINASALDVLMKAILWGAIDGTSPLEAPQAGASSLARCTLQATDGRLYYGG